MIEKPLAFLWDTVYIATVHFQYWCYNNILQYFNTRYNNIILTEEWYAFRRVRQLAADYQLIDCESQQNADIWSE